MYRSKKSIFPDNLCVHTFKTVSPILQAECILQLVERSQKPGMEPVTTVAHPPPTLIAFGVILDDLVFPDGHTLMGVLGGGGPQTAFGMRLPALAGWTDQVRVGLVAGVGHDLPNANRRYIDYYVSGVVD